MLVVLCDNCYAIALKVPTGSTHIPRYTFSRHEGSLHHEHYEFCSKECENAYVAKLLKLPLDNCTTKECTLLAKHTAQHKPFQRHSWLSS